MTPSEKFKTLRLLLNMRQVDIAEFFGMSERKVQYIESGELSSHEVVVMNYYLVRELIRKGYAGKSAVKNNKEAEECIHKLITKENGQ